MKALDEYFLMVVFTLLLSTVHVFTNFMVNHICNLVVSALFITFRVFGVRKRRTRVRVIKVGDKIVLLPRKTASGKKVTTFPLTPSHSSPLTPSPPTPSPLTPSHPSPLTPFPLTPSPTHTPN